MQKASNSTRAYYVSAVGLRGFVMRNSLTKVLNTPYVVIQIFEVFKHQIIDMQAVREQLDAMKTNKERMSYLSEYYPALCIYALKKLGMDQELREYMETCKSCENDASKYSKYIHGYWLL